eukprot:scaffold2858_cov659-Pavlova_lutheri.AAC.49
MASDLAQRLCAPRQIERDAALEELRGQLDRPEDMARAEEAFQVLLERGRKGDAWTARASAMHVASALAMAEKDVVKAAERTQEMVHAILEHLEDPEPRVREAVAEAARVVGARGRADAVRNVRSAAVRSVRDNFERVDDGGEVSPISRTNPGPGDEDSDEEDEWLVDMLRRANAAPKPGTGTFRPSTEGWRCLETSLRTLQSMAEGRAMRRHHRIEAGPKEEVEEDRILADEETLALLAKAMLHENRFVREAAHRVVAALCEGSSEEDVYALGHAFASFLARGLGDNWSQVRYAASTATRAFLLHVGGKKPEFFELLLPRMALNRHYVAEGVRNYSQETWEAVMGNHGREWMAKVFPHVAKYYVQQCKADNHAVREAACACIAEAMAKVNRGAVAPHVPTLLKALLVCFRDESWPVRDVACTATARAAMEFSEEARPLLDELYRLWFDHLWDNIASVRDNSAFALAQVRRAYGVEAETRILPLLEERLCMAKQQPEDSKRFSNLENVSTFGVAHARRLLEEDDDGMRDNQTMFSCGSLAPKLRRGSGCMDHGFQREKEPWEASDGAICLVAELSCVIPDKVLVYMEPLSELAYVRHFSHYYNLQETLWRKLPIIAENVGKKKFKMHVDLFIGPMFEALKCGHQLTECAAGKCILFFQKMLGEGILTARLDEGQKHLLQTSEFTACSTAPVTPLR